MLMYSSSKEAILKKEIIPPYVPKDFDDFWTKALAEEASKELIVTKKVSDHPYKNMMVYDVTYNSIDDTIIHAYFVTPKDVTEPLPCVVQYHGGNGKRTIQWEYPAVDMCCLSIDVRGQNGCTVDKAHYTSGGEWNHAIVSGILNKEEYYLRNMYLDAVRAVRVAKSFEEVCGDRIGIKGQSQGGGIVLAVAGLCNDIKSMVCFSPSYTCIRNRIEDKTGVLGNVSLFLQLHPEYTDIVWDNMAYFDGLNFAERVQSKTLVCCTLADPICLPRYVYSAYDAIQADKEIFYAPFTPHIITEDMSAKKLRFFMENL